MSKLQNKIQDHHRKKYTTDIHKTANNTKRGITQVEPTYRNYGTYGTATYGVGQFDTEPYKNYPLGYGSINMKDV